ncbi:MAG TPA: phosphoglucosamine mutase [Solirubrobacterales bacterium]|nr:phosphoglucosamine mutase [Solirubrobacterales bacterium]
MAADRSLFGTDGVRGQAGTYLTPELATALGRAATTTLGLDRPQVLIVRDTRESGPMLEAALAAGIADAGGDALLCGVLPTAAAAALVRKLGLDLAVVVSASHNPYADNGIKFFSGAGIKLADDDEARLEEAVRDALAAAQGAGTAAAPYPIGRVRELRGAEADYLRALEEGVGLDLTGRRVLLDCANGAAYSAAPEIFMRLGAEVILTGAEPDGRNINDRCGSTHTEAIARRMATGEAEIGFAFDGDADRVLAIDASGQTRDGDELIALIAGNLAAAGELSGGVAVTVMTNHGFHLAMAEAGIEVATTAVGDRYVLAELLERGWRVGGEQSGHLINTDFAPTGDGIAAALLVMRALGERRLDQVHPFQRLPQRLINVKVTDRDAVQGNEAVAGAIEQVTAELGGHGRVLIRPSGTEPLVRVMVEAPETTQADETCERLAAVVTAELGR